MNQELLALTLTHIGVHPQALEDARARAERQFGDNEPDAAALAAWGESLKGTAPHLFPVPAVPDMRLSPEEKLTRHRPATSEKHIRNSPPLTDAAHIAEVDALSSPTSRLTRYREILAERSR
jgi:hypothetical protein